MPSQAWEKRLCSLIKKYKPSADLASFRNDYREAVFQAAADNKLDKAAPSLLLEARDYLEAWASPSPPEASTAYGQWQKLYQAGKSCLPVAVLETILRRFPAVPDGTVDWGPFLLGCSDGRLIDVLLDRRLVREHDLNGLAQARPAEFHESVALDVALERSLLSNPRPVWDECARGKPRPRGLLSRERVLLHCYSLLPGEEGNERMASFLVSRPQERAMLLDLLLGDHPSAVRLCRYLALGPPSTACNGPGNGADAIQDILLGWVSRCEAEVEKGAVSKAATASLVLALIRLASLSCPKGEGTNGDRRLGGAAGRATERATVHVLQKVEGDLSSHLADATLSVRGGELYRTVQEYLRRLPVGTRRGEDSPERALRYERYLGSKQVIEQVLAALDEPLDEGGLRDALEVALFNCGVRSLGNLNERLSFDAHAHEADTAGVLPGDLVTVIRPGRCLGDGEERVVLVKARVQPAPGNETLALPGASP
jgi:hypothetical protein